MRLEFIHTKDEQNKDVRECQECHGWKSLLGTKDENGNTRTTNTMPCD